jgi:enolase
MPTISRIHAREVLDSRGNPTVEVEVHCHGGARGRAIAPSGASTGRHEALELRDRDQTRYGGKGVRRAVANVNEVIAPRLVDHPIMAQAGIDRLLCELDGTPNKSRLGANATLAVSLACAHAAAATQEMPLYQYLNPQKSGTLPLPMVNMISGGLHAGGNLDFQDFLLLPIGAASYSEALEMSVRVYRELGQVLTRHGFEAALVGDEGGYGPRLDSNQQAVEYILDAIDEAGYAPGQDAALAIDVASTHFFREGTYHWKKAPDTPLDGATMVDVLQSWVERFPILSIEDGLAEDDWSGWQALTAALGQQIQLIGDDLFATNPARLRRGIQEQVGNSILVKLNQIGTLTETWEVIALARQAGYAPVISARSGETEDTTIADLAVATGAGQIKIGCIVRGERLAKYNQLLRIEEAMAPQAVFAGRQALACRCESTAKDQ